MWQKNKTVEALRAEAALVQRALLIPGVPEDEKRIYSDTLIKINNEIAAKLAIQSSSNAPEPSVEGASEKTIHTTVIRAGITPPRTPATASATPPPEPPVISGGSGGAQKQVVIHWGEGASDLFTEGEARGRFTTALRDLAASRMAKIGRMNDIPQYTTFSRAVAYYRALTEFWATPPTAQQLAIAPLGRLKQEIFEMITSAAANQK